MRVRSVTPDQHKAYSDAQVNQSITIDEFNGANTQEPQPKSKKPVPKSKKTSDKKSSQSANSVDDSTKENILEEQTLINTYQNQSEYDDGELF